MYSGQASQKINLIPFRLRQFLKKIAYNGAQCQKSHFELCLPKQLGLKGMGVTHFIGMIAQNPSAQLYRDNGDPMSRVKPSCVERHNYAV